MTFKFSIELIGAEIWMAEHHVLKVWIFLLLKSDLDGIVVGCSRLLSRLAGVSDHDWSDAIQQLSTKYNDDVTLTQENGRIVIKNKIRMLKSKEDARNDARIRQARWRAKRSDAK